MEYVDITVDGPVALIRMDRPPMNALSEVFGQELKSAFARCEDPSIRAVVVSGQPHFAAGADINDFKKTFESGSEEKTASTLLEAIRILENLAKPTIAAVHGYALGGGCELSLGCDFRYMADNAKIGQPEILLGIIPGAGGTQRLQRVIGFQKAKELIYTGRQVGAEEGLAIGYADKVAPSDELLDLALSDAAAWAVAPTAALAAAKRALADGRGLTLADALAVEEEAFRMSMTTDDAVEGVNAFIEKREAHFKGS